MFLPFVLSSFPPIFKRQQERSGRRFGPTNNKLVIHFVIQHLYATTTNYCVDVKSAMMNLIVDFLTVEHHGSATKTQQEAQIIHCNLWIVIVVWSKRSCWALAPAVSEEKEEWRRMHTELEERGGRRRQDDKKRGLKQPSLFHMFLASESQWRCNAR